MEKPNIQKNNIVPFTLPIRQQKIAEQKNIESAKRLRDFSKVVRFVSEDSIMSDYDARRNEILGLENEDKPLEGVGVSGLMKKDDIEPYSTKGCIPYYEMANFLKTELQKYDISPEVDQFCNAHYMHDKLMAVSYIAEKPKFKLKGYKYIVFISFGVSENMDLQPKSFACYVSEKSLAGYFDDANNGKVEKKQDDKHLFVRANFMNRQTTPFTQKDIKELGLERISNLDMFKIKLDK